MATGAGEPTVPQQQQPLSSHNEQVQATGSTHPVRDAAEIAASAATPTQPQMTANTPQASQHGGATETRTDQAFRPRSVRFITYRSAAQRGTEHLTGKVHQHPVSEKDAAVQSPRQFLQYQSNAVHSLESGNPAGGSAAEPVPVTAKQTVSASKPQAKHRKSRPSFVEGF